MHAEFIPAMLISGVDAKGKRYQLPGWGQWWDDLEESVKPNIMKIDYLTRRQTRAYWEWAERKDRMPKKLRIAITWNRDYFDWVLVSKAGHLMKQKLPHLIDDEIGDYLRAAFANAVIRTRYDHGEHDEHGNLVAMYGIHINTDEFVHWLRKEFNVKVSKAKVACFPDDGELFEMLWPKEMLVDESSPYYK